MLSDNRLQHLACPQRKREGILPRVPQGYRLVDPLNLFGTQLRRTSSSLACIQCTPSACSIPGQPTIDGSTSDSERTCHHLRRFSSLNSRDGPFPQLRQFPMFQSASICLVHGDTNTTLLALCQYYYETVNIYGLNPPCGSLRPGNVPQEIRGPSPTCSLFGQNPSARPGMDPAVA